MDLKKEIGRNIRDARKMAKLTQSELGELVGVTKEHMSNVENGKSGLGGLDLIAQIASATKLPAEELLRIDTKNPPQVDDLEGFWLELRRRALVARQSPQKTTQLIELIKVLLELPDDARNYLVKFLLAQRHQSQKESNDSVDQTQIPKN